MPAQTVRLTEKAAEALDQLKMLRPAQTKTAIIEEALDRLDTQYFWERAESAYRQGMADSDIAARQLESLAQWDIGEFSTSDRVSTKPGE